MAANLTVPDLKFEKYTLSNGLDVILLEDHRLPLVAVNVWYHVGPANERPGLTGFAHLFEHMMFEGSKHVGEKGHFRYLEAAGASDINGTTDFDRTNYFETLPSNQLELALWLESDRMGFLLETLDVSMLRNQRDVVRNERRQSIESAPYGVVQEEVFHLLYPKNHPYYASIMGSHEDIQAARLADVRAFFRQYYAPNNASLAVVGDIDPAAAKKLIERYFAPIAAGPAVPRLEVETPPITSQRRAVVGDQVELPRLYLAWITDRIFTQGDAECDLAARILGQGKSSRLFQRLVDEDRIAQDVVAHQYSLALGSIFTIEATAKPGFTAEVLEKEIDEELDAFRRRGPTEFELQGARNAIETAILRGLETLGGFGGIADRLNQYNHFLKDPGFLSRDLARYERATITSVREAADRQLSQDSRVTVYAVPGKKVIHDVPNTADDEVGTPAEASETLDGQAWRTEAPMPGRVSSLKLPIPEISRLPNGLAIYLIEQHSLPIVSANLIVLSGSERNPLTLPGLASFTAEMLDEGTQKRSALQIARDVEQIGATLSTSSSTDVSYAAIRCLKRNVDSAFDLLSDVILHPEFPEQEIDRIRNDRLTHILQQQDNPNALAAKLFSYSVYGGKHPYGYTEIGTEDSNVRISQHELRSFWQSGYTPANSALVVAGDISERGLLDLAERCFGAWSGNATLPEVPAIAENPNRRVVIVDKPGAPQTVLRVGHVGIARSNRDYVAVEVMNTALGGLFSSRINLNLREKHGFTYGASSGFVYRRGPGPFLVASGVRTDVTAPAITEILYELDRMRSSDITVEELAVAKDSISRSLPGAFETTSQAASSTGQLVVDGLPRDYYRTLPSEIDRTTAADVRRVADKYLRPQSMVIVAVGDRSKIESEIEKLHLGPIEVRDKNDKLHS